MHEWHENEDNRCKKKMSSSIHLDPNNLFNVHVRLIFSLIGILGDMFDRYKSAHKRDKNVFNHP